MSKQTIDKVDETEDGAPDPLDGVDVVSVSGGAIGAARAEAIDVSFGAVGATRAESVVIDTSAVGVVIANEANIDTAFIGPLLAREVHLERAIAQTVVAQRVEVTGNALTVFLVAQRVDGTVRTLFDWRGALVFGLAFGLVAGIARLGRRR